MKNEVADAVMGELKKAGATDVHMTKRRVHNRVYYTHNSETRFYVVPSTVSDRRAKLNAVAEIRRILGVTPVTRNKKDKQKKRPRKKPCIVPALPQTIVTGKQLTGPHRT